MFFVLFLGNASSEGMSVIVLSARLPVGETLVHHFTCSVTCDTRHNVRLQRAAAGATVNRRG